MKSIELQLHDLQILVQEGRIEEVFNKIYNELDLVMALTTALKNNPNFKCPYHGPMMVSIPEPEIRCGDCEEAEWLGTKPAGELKSKDEYLNGPEAA